MIKESVGQRGKAAEKAVKTLLEKLNNQADFAFWRLADARAAGGRLQAQPGDFAYFSKGKGGVLEVKSTEHDYRLTKDAVSQLPTLTKLHLAGAQCPILVLHKALNQWRVIFPIDLPIGPPSWDLRQFPLYGSAEEALRSTGFF